MTDVTADETPTDWTRTTRNLLLGRIAEDIRPEIADWLGVYRADVRAAAFREAADLIDAKAKTVLDDIPEDEQNPSDQDRYQEWLSAGDVLRAAVKVVAGPCKPPQHSTATVSPCECEDQR
jgi:hypothetical protein